MLGDEASRSVLVTGGSGYVAGWIIADLLSQGWSVRTTIRNLVRQEGLRKRLAAYAPIDRLSFHAANLLDDRGWDEAVAGVSHVIHTASPMPVGEYRTQDLIKPARDGVRHVLEAAGKAGVNRIVMTSSTAAAAPDGESLHGEASWTDPAAPNLGNYAQAKTLAERDAWAMASAPGRALALTTILPAAIAGPFMDEPTGWSEVLRGLLAGERPALPRIGFNFVHIRDVVDLHIRALTDDALVGRRVIAAGGFLWMQDIAQILRDHYGERAAKVPTRRAPDWVMRAVALVNAEARLTLPALGKSPRFDSGGAEVALGRPLMSPSQAIIDAVDGLIARDFA